MNLPKFFESTQNITGFCNKIEQKPAYLRPSCQNRSHLRGALIEASWAKRHEYKPVY